MAKPQHIRLVGVKQNNLKNITAEFPMRKLTVVTGLSGSGKSSLAFDTLYAEGQRRYVESLSTYTRQFLDKMQRPEVDTVENIPPAIALEQRNTVVGSRSTVGTQTEILDFLRVLFAKVGTVHCTECGGKVQRMDATAIVTQLEKLLVGKKAALVAPLSDALLPKKKKKGAPTFDSFREVLMGQGFRRILVRRGGTALDWIDLEDDVNGSVVEGAEKVDVVVDRFRLTASSLQDESTRNRLRDSVEQGLAVGLGHLEIVDMDSGQSWKFRDAFACPDCATEFREPEPNLFSFQSPLGACSNCSGFGFTLDVAETQVVPDPSKTLKSGAVDPFTKPSYSDWQKVFLRFAERNGISIAKRWKDLTAQEKKILWEGVPKDKSFPGIVGFFEGLAEKKYKIHVRVFIRRYQSQNRCPDCEGTRLKREARAVLLGEKTIGQVLDLPLDVLLPWVRNLELSATQRKIAREALLQMERRLEFLVEVGVGYLTLARLTKSLSGGEFQRINLATQLGSGLCGTLYVLDEPSIGLHAADTERLIRVLERLRDQGNTVVVVEHELDVVKKADWMLELGPLAGRQGGNLVFQGTPQECAQSTVSVTGPYLRNAVSLLASGTKSLAKKMQSATGTLELLGCSENNLQNIDVSIPLNRLVVVTGVSGSGKSTLVHGTLYAALQRLYTRDESEHVGAHRKLKGAEHLGGVVLLDQKPIGKSSRSNPATYMGAWDDVRQLYAKQAVSLRRGFSPQHFSFNVEGGRCPICKGEGEIAIDMHFMAEIHLPCEECGGKRFTRKVLEVSYKGKNVSELLETTIDEAYELFRDHPALERKLRTLKRVGLGYLLLGQSGATLSGGESQRLKVAAALEERPGEKLLYLFDEPSTGLHLEDIKKLYEVLRGLVESGHSVVLIEHQMDLIAGSDWVIDLGPGGGAAGGQVVAVGPPQSLVAHAKTSATGRMLKQQGYFR